MTVFLSENSAFMIGKMSGIGTLFIIDRQSFPGQGASIKYVGTEGGGGPKIGQFCRQTVLQMCRQGGGGPKKPKNLRMYLMEAPCANA